ncbi:MAG TPA: thiamine-phosphate kinase [Chloroflexota bacterium]|nr:thiamine-phosphate kinase [Chloroflexota bacterium]
MTPEPELRVADIGEFDLIDRIRQQLDRSGTGIVFGVGDDSAVLRPDPGRVILATTDSSVEDIHFRLSSTTPELLGRRVLAVNLSDIAAMGGRPRWALLTLNLPSNTTVEFVERFAAGLSAEAALYDTVVVGGNLARSPDRLIVDITLLGDGEPENILYRHGAHPGDRVLVTGTLGDSAAGLALLRGETSAVPSDHEFLVGRHRLPIPRVEAGRAIGASRLATAMLDLSDGLASDLVHICQASQVGATIHANQVPLSDELSRLAASSDHDPVDWALHGGEDYELLLTAPAASIDPLVALLHARQVRLTEIGEVTEGSGLTLVVNGRRESLGGASWHHFGAGSRA